MARFTISKIFTPWTDATVRPARAGWYRTRTERLTHSWWNGMAYFDGQAWWTFGQYATMAIRQEVKVLEWQGLAMPLAQAIAVVRENMPRSRGARRKYEKFLADTLGAAA